MARTSLKRFLTELKRRKVYHVAVAYVLVGLAVAQGAEWAFSLMELPVVASRAVAVVVALGFPIALVLAWAYEIRPEIPTDDAEAQQRPSPGPPIEVEESRASIVVLPFDNFSPEPGDAYLSDGLTEEIITNLSYVRSLRVISRNSAMVLKGSRKSTRDIGEELGVDYVLEGSVRKAGGDLRITAQLIRADTDEHVWAESYDGDLDDVFGMQESVSRSIVDSLHVRLRPDEERRLSARPIEDFRAYEYYLKARQESWRFTREALDRATAYLQQAVEIIGENALLLSGLAYVYAQYVNAGLEHEEFARRAEEHARRALELDPESSEALLVLGFLYGAALRDPIKSNRYLERSLEINPDDSHALTWLIVGYSAVGRMKPVPALAERALRVDPLTPMVRAAVAASGPMAQGRFDEATANVEEWYRIEPENPAALMFYALSLTWSGRTDEARDLLETQLGDDPQGSFARMALLIRHALAGEQERIRTLMTGRFRDNAIRDPQLTFFTASMHALAGMDEETLEWVEHALESGFTNYPWLAEHDPFLSRYRGDPRFEPVFERMRAEWESVVAQ